MAMDASLEQGASPTEGASPADKGPPCTFGAQPHGARRGDSRTASLPAGHPATGCSPMLGDTGVSHSSVSMQDRVARSRQAAGVRVVPSPREHLVVPVSRMPAAISGLGSPCSPSWGPVSNHPKPSCSSCRRPRASPGCLLQGGDSGSPQDQALVSSCPGRGVPWPQPPQVQVQRRPQSRNAAKTLKHGRCWLPGGSEHAGDMATRLRAAAPGTARCPGPCGGMGGTWRGAGLLPRGRRGRTRARSGGAQGGASTAQPSTPSSAGRGQHGRRCRTTSPRRPRGARRRGRKGREWAEGAWRGALATGRPAWPSSTTWWSAPSATRSPSTRSSPRSAREPSGERLAGPGPPRARPRPCPAYPGLPRPRARHPPPQA